MSKATSSPTSRLLRSSRLFSLPRPLPSAQLDRPSAQGQYKGSDTATLPYPTHQAIATPASSNFRGDWGLKRPLPAKSTRRTSTPVIRVYQQDTYEHITDFSSAADHVLNARKWAEMGVPMIHHRANSQQPKISAYEEAYDCTVAGAAEAEPSAPEPAPALLPGRRLKVQPRRQTVPTSQRWKYSGPWIAGMQEQEFSVWLKRTLAEIQGSTAWLDFVCQRYEDRRLLVAQRRAREEGEPIDAEEAQRLRKLLRPSHEECQGIIKQLRDAHETQKLHSELTALICDFLDLPGVQRQGASNSQTNFASNIFSSLGTGVDSRGPPSTHPGGGLSYVRTNAYMENHPVYGPQTHRSPVLARVLRTRTSTARFAQRQAQLGVGGFVTLDPFSATLAAGSKTQGQPPSADVLAHELDPDLEGGNKIWVNPDTATMEANGSIDLRVTRATSEAIAVKTGDVQSILESKAAVFTQSPSPGTATPTLRGDRVQQGRFGSAQPRSGQRLPGINGFDEDGRIGPAGGARNGQQMIGRLQGLYRQSQEQQRRD